MSYERFFKYKEELEKDLKIDQFTIGDKVNQIPHLKHFWVAKLIESKIELKSLQKRKNELIKEITEKTKAELQLSLSSTNNIINKAPVIVEINEKIEELELVIEYLEKAEKIFSSMTYDIKNSIEILKMENQ